MKNKLIKILIAISLITLLTSCLGGDDGDGSSGVVAPVDVSGTWSISEQIDNTQCGGTGDTDSYSVTVTQNGSGITVVSSDGTFSGTVSGNTVSWTGEFYNSDQGLWITITSMSLTITGDNFSGTANWEARNTQGGAVICTGSTTVNGIRTGGGSLDPDAPTGLNATVLSATSIQISWSDNSDNEQSFLIERAIGSPNAFSQVATVATNVNSYTDMNLTPSTSYYYQVRATNSSGDSAYSNIAQATTPAASGSAPAAPGALSASALSSSSVQLNWTDAANNEDGYRIERGLSTVSYTQVAQIAPNSSNYTDTAGIQASTKYYYRVVAYNSSGNNSATTSVQTPATTTNYTLTVSKAGTGSGTVTSTPAGIDCGSDCTHTATSGTTITLTASSLSGSTFAGWSGCNSSSGSSCTVSLTSNKTVTASFNIVISTSVTLSLPTTNTTGNYTLSWTVSGLSSTSWSIQEDSDTSFASPVYYYLNYASPPYSYSFSNKSNGTYCYRVKGPVPVWSEAKCITVAMATSATLRIFNNTKYDMIDLKLNNVQKISYPYGIAAGQSADFVFNSGGSVSVNYGVGFYDYVGYRDIWFTGTSNVTLTSGQTFTLTANNPTLGTILSGFSTSRNWDGVYYCYSCSYLIHSARFNFASNGSWKFYDDGVFVGSGATTLVSWPTYGSTITFKICSSCQNIQLPYPFGIFKYNNGPPDWPNIEYVGQ